MLEVAQYVGVAGTTQVQEIQQIREMLDCLRWPTGLRFMNGPLVSRKTLLGETPDDPVQYSPIEQVAPLLCDDPRFFNVMHFNSRDPRLAGQLEQIATLSPNLHGIQLNILWPQVAELRRFRHRYPDVQLILQLSRHTLSSVGNRTQDLIACLRPYAGVADYLLFDPSGGEGKPYDHSEASQLLIDLQASELPMQLGVTGGLCADRCWRLRRLLDRYPQLCWDAQSGLRDPGDGNCLDLGRCYGFLAASRSLLG